MDRLKGNQQSGSYTSNLIGNIRAHLAGLQGYDIMALELIQNADDAKANEVIFDVTDEGLLVYNDKEFTYCGDLNGPCDTDKNNGHTCDYHRIIDVGSGGKLSLEGNIGRFGIGFVSTYQVTDHPEICSAGIKLDLYPAEGQWVFDISDKSNGTTFFLPWAMDANTPTRRGLGISPITPSHIDSLIEEFKNVLLKSLLFLRNIESAELRHNGKLVFACNLNRNDASDLSLSFKPSGDVEKWHIIRTDAVDAAQELCERFSRLKELKRSTKISIGLRISPEPLSEGLLYAYLPTEQSIGLPFHINADFFPETDRKAINFSGDQHQQAWNEMLIETAAKELAKAPDELLELLGHKQMWGIIDNAFNLSKKSLGNYTCFKSFWQQFKETVPKTNIVLAYDGSWQCPNNVFLPKNRLDEQQSKTLLEVGGLLVHEDLSSFHNVMTQLGTPILNLERFLTLIETPEAKKVIEAKDVDTLSLKDFYYPLWGLINDLMPVTDKTHSNVNPLEQRVRNLPFFITENHIKVDINRCYSAPNSIEASSIAALLPKRAIASRLLLRLDKISKLLKILDLASVVSYLNHMSNDVKLEDLISIDFNDLREFYLLLAKLDQFVPMDRIKAENTYIILRDLPILKSGEGFVAANDALLPGDFTDPTGQANLLDISLLNEDVKNFLVSKLNVKELTVDNFVLEVLPRLFNDNGPIVDYSSLVSELAKHSTLIENAETRDFLSKNFLVPTQDGNWSYPVNIYRRTDDLVKVLGDANHLWLDENRIPNTRAVHTFINDLRMLTSPTAEHLVDRMISLAARHSPTEDVKRASSEAFYTLCDKYEKWKDNRDAQAAITILRSAICFPVDNDDKSWSKADSLYAYYRAEAFHSQAKILDFKAAGRLNNDLLIELGIKIRPETQLVINHLKYCISNNLAPHNTTYQILNKRVSDDAKVIKEFCNMECIYVAPKSIFIRPNQLFWLPQKLGRYTYAIPENLKNFRPFFDAIGVKNEPDSTDFVDILLKIVAEYYCESKILIGEDELVYNECLGHLAKALSEESIDNSDLERLRKAPTILNLLEEFHFPNELLLQDSEWHAEFFNHEIDKALCKPTPELTPLFLAIGIKCLSENAQIKLDFVDGTQKDEEDLTLQLNHRCNIFARLLYDKPETVVENISRQIISLKVVSYDNVRIQATVMIAEDLSVAPNVPAPVFYDIDSGRLIITRPVDEKGWALRLNALLHQLMPQETNSEISKLVLSLRPLMEMDQENADRELTDAGIPPLRLKLKIEPKEDITSPILGDIGTHLETGYDEEIIDTITIDSNTIGDENDVLEDIAINEYHTSSDDKSASRIIEKATEAHRSDAQPELPTRKVAETNRNALQSVTNNTANEEMRRERKPREGYKEQWDRGLLTYVRPKSSNDGKESEYDNRLTHNLAVEVKARQAVCDYEEKRGREAIQKAQTHPGFDIISTDKITGKERFIEVKGVNGEWNQTGVGLSKTQFLNAQDLGDQYWLYVVEFVSDPERIRVHPIANPANLVKSFMYDGNWRDVVTEENADPSLLFVPGVRIKHKNMGLGVIRDVVVRGNSKLFTIHFDGKQHPTPNISFNLTLMHIIGDADGENNT